MPPVPFLSPSAVDLWPQYYFFLIKLCLKQLFQSPHATLRKLALGSVNQYVMLMPTVSAAQLDLERLVSSVCVWPQFHILRKSVLIHVQVLYVSMDKYLQGLFLLANDPIPEVRKLVRNSFIYVMCELLYSNPVDVCIMCQRMKVTQSCIPWLCNCYVTFMSSAMFMH